VGGTGLEPVTPSL